MKILVDADACPRAVKEILFRAVQRVKIKTTLIANQYVRVPLSEHIDSIAVSAGPDEADDRIVELVEADDLVITADIPLAARCLSRGARVVGPSGRRFTEDGIGAALAMRDLKSHLRDSGEIRDHDPPFTKQDRSRFLQALEQAVQAAKKS